MSDEKLSVKKAQAVARHLNDKGDSRISASACLYRTPEQVAISYLGSKAGKAQISALANEIRELVGMPTEGVKA